MNRLALALALVLALAVPAAAQVPNYISTLAAYQVRALQGSSAPTNGSSSMASVTPSQWYPGEQCCGGGLLTGVINAWSGGAKSQVDTKLYVNGGGHVDSGNDGIYVFDFSGAANPTGWTLVGLAPVANVNWNTSPSAPGGATKPYGGGYPYATHTYDGLVMATNGNMYHWSGYNTDVYKFNFATGTWTQLADNPATEPAEKLTFYDAAQQKILVAQAGGSNAPFQYYVFRVSNETQSANKSWPSGYPGMPTTRTNNVACYDSSRSRGLVIGNGGAELVTINWAAETGTIATQALSGLPGMTGPSCVYDAARDVYWVLGGQPGSAGWSNIYEINASSFVVTGHPLTGDAIQVNSSMIGSFGRLVFLGSYRAIGIVASETSPAYVIKLPGSAPAPPPNAPSGVKVQ
jgi:hypothetical protein